MTDLEICKRIAEIEGLKTVTGLFLNESDKVVYINPDDCIPIVPIHYNPLTDDTLCFQLMKKYKIWICYEMNDDVNACCYPDTNVFSREILVTDKDLNRAICLVIIQVHEN